MKNILAAWVIATSAALFSQWVSAEEVTCPISIDLNANKANGCIAENKQYLALIRKAQCDVRDVVHPKTSKKWPLKILNVEYQILSKYDKWGSRGVRDYKTISFSTYWDSKSPCLDLVKYAWKQVLDQVDKN
jgi:hypothetical protein